MGHYLLEMEEDGVPGSWKGPSAPTPRAEQNSFLEEAARAYSAHKRLRLALGRPPTRAECEVLIRRDCLDDDRVARLVEAASLEVARLRDAATAEVAAVIKRGGGGGGAGDRS